MLWLWIVVVIILAWIAYLLIPALRDELRRQKGRGGSRASEEGE